MAKPPTPPKNYWTLNGVRFSHHATRVYQVFDADSRCVGAWDSQEKAVHVLLSTQPAGYLVACDEYSGIGMASNHVCAIARWASPGPERTTDVPGFAPIAQARSG